MGIFDSIGHGFKSFGDWVNDNAIQPFNNKVLTPLYDNAIKPAWNDVVKPGFTKIENVVETPFKTAENIATGAEKMSEAWANRAGSLTNDVITGVDNSVVGIGKLLSTPIVPIALGLGALYLLKK